MNKIELLFKMVENHPENAEAWYLLGVEYLEQAKPGEAMKAFLRSLQYCQDELRVKILEELNRLSNKIDESGNRVTLSDNSFDNEEPDNEPAGALKLKVIQGGKNGGVSRIDDHIQPVITFEDVGGLESLKETIRMKIIKPFANPGLFARFKKKTGGGILLYGPPGCGKTFVAKATAGECRARFISVRITDILDPYIGVSEQNVKDLFDSARAKKPCIMFFDEVDSIGYNRSKASSEHLRPVVDQMLSEMEGIDSDNDRLLFIGATNMPWDVDPAFKRPGRFDKMIFVPPPDQEARTAIFKLKLAERPTSSDIDLSFLARQTELYSGADIDNIIEIAAENVLVEIMKTGVERPIRMQDLLDALENTKPSTIEWLRTIKNYVKYANQGGLYDDVEKYLTRHKKALS